MLHASLGYTDFCVYIDFTTAFSYFDCTACMPVNNMSPGSESNNKEYIFGR